MKKYIGEYKNPTEDSSAYKDTSMNGYFNYENDRNNRLLSGESKGNFTENMAGQEIELRTIVQNLTDDKENKITMKMWVRHSDGSVAVTDSGTPVSDTKVYDIPVWSTKGDFYSDTATNGNGVDFESGLVNCSKVYKIPDNAKLKNGDTVAFEIIDKDGNVLADDNTETQSYASVKIEYKFEDGTDMPNTDSTAILVPVGTTIDWNAPKEMYGYTYAGADGIGKKVSADGLTVTYYYADPNSHTHTWSDWTYNGDAEYTSSSNYKDGTASRHCTTEGCDETETKTIANTGLFRARSANASFGAEILMNVGTRTAQVNAFDEVYCKFTREDGLETNVPLSKATVSGSNTMFPYGVTPQSMSSAVKITYYGKVDGILVWGPEYTYTMTTNYIVPQLNKSTSEVYKKFLVELMYYGAAAQVYNNWKTDKPMTDELTDEQKALHDTSDLTLTNITNTKQVEIDNAKTTLRAVNVEYGSVTVMLNMVR